MSGQRVSQTADTAPGTTVPAAPPAPSAGGRHGVLLDGKAAQIELNPAVEPGAPSVAVRFQVRDDVTVGKRLRKLPCETSLWMAVELQDKDAKSDAAGGGKGGKDGRGGGGFGGAWRPAGIKPVLVEACGPLQWQPHTVVDADFTKHNMLAVAVRRAFYEHYPLRLSPDVIWLTIVQGLAEHVQQDPEKHRSSFDIAFEGKQRLVVQRPGFVKGSADNDWTSVFPEFTQQIGEFIGKDLLSTMSCDFSTTDPVTRICSHVAIMDCVQSYFEYGMLCCGCGIPSIELTGVAADWHALRGKAEALLKRFAGLEDWLAELLFLLDQFCAAADGQPDLNFWNSVCSIHGLSGNWSGFMTGWLQILFPYLQGGRKSGGIGQWRTSYQAAAKRLEAAAAGGEQAGMDELAHLNAETEVMRSWHGWGCAPAAGYAVKWSDFPTGLSQAPVLYVDMSTDAGYKMSFNGGIAAVVQHAETLALEPVCSWAVLDHGPA